MNILVVHRIEVFADALAAHLRGAPGVRHVGVAYGADQCAPALSHHAYDIVLITQAGMERCVRLRRAMQGQQLPRVKVVVATAGFNPGLVAEAQHAGMDAMVRLNQPIEGLASELAAVMAGTRRLDTDPGIESLARGPEWGGGPPIDYRDEVDIEIVRLLATGLCDKDIASRVYLSSQTVRNRVSRILRDSHIDNRTHLAARYLRHEIHTLLA